MATTSRHGWATPDNTDRVADGAAAIRLLGDSIDTAVPILYWANDSVTVASGDTEVVTFTFPSGLFPSTPDIQATITRTNFNCSVTARSTTSCDVTVRNEGGSTNTGDVMVLAYSS